MSNIDFAPATTEQAARLIEFIDELSAWVRSGRGMGLGNVSIANSIRAKFLDDFLLEWWDGINPDPLTEAQIAVLGARRKAAEDALRIDTPEGQER